MERTLREKLEFEHIIKEEPVTWIDSETLMQSGRLVLTERHLVFMLNDVNEPAIIIDLDTINSLAHETVRTDHNVLVITYLQFYPARFSVLDYDEWEKAIELTRMTPHVRMHLPVMDEE
jgi:hypothetical protein